MIIHADLEQGSEAWFQARRGVVTGSRFKDARDKLKSGAPSKAAMDYAKDLARERLGGKAPAKFQTAAMRQGSEEEPKACAAYEAETGNMVTKVGFVTTDDGLFGVSPDGLVGGDGAIEIKTMVSSDTLFAAFVAGDHSEYADQCLGYLWLLGIQWVDLVLWCPDLEAIKITRITRDEDAIERLENDLMAFAKMVNEHEAALRKALWASKNSQCA